MVGCLVLGDSLAAGIGLARPECEVVATPGIASERFVRTWIGTRSAQSIVISLGANDGSEVDTLANLRRLRDAVVAETVYWLLY